MQQNLKLEDVFLDFAQSKVWIYLMKKKIFLKIFFVYFSVKFVKQKIFVE